MTRSTLISARRVGLRMLAGVIVGGAVILLHGSCLAGDEADQPPTQSATPPSVRSGGLLEESYNYHRHQPLQTAAAAGGYPATNGWYGYGFPVQSYRWGWFGAERNYPRVMWHQGYYGDSVRTAYRYGY